MNLRRRRSSTGDLCLARRLLLKFRGRPSPACFRSDLPSGSCPGLSAFTAFTCVTLLAPPPPPAKMLMTVVSLASAGSLAGWTPPVAGCSITGSLARKLAVAQQGGGAWPRPQLQGLIRWRLMCSARSDVPPPPGPRRSCWGADGRRGRRHLSPRAAGEQTEARLNLGSRRERLQVQRHQ